MNCDHRTLHGYFNVSITVQCDHSSLLNNLNSPQMAKHLCSKDHIGTLIQKMKI